MFPLEKYPCFICDEETELNVKIEIKKVVYKGGSKETELLYESHPIELCKRCISKMKKHFEEFKVTPESILIWIIDR